MTADLMPITIDFDTEFLPATEEEELLVSAFNEPSTLWSLRYRRLFGLVPDTALWADWKRRAATEAVTLMRDKTKRRAIENGRPLDRGIITLEARAWKEGES